MKRAQLATLFLLCLVVFGATNYGGVRSADSEVGFLTAESLADRGRFAVPDQRAQWRGFGLARGRDGRLYSIFGPLQPLLEAPVIRLAQAVNRSRWYERRADAIPLSHFNQQMVRDVLTGERPADLEPHALRFVVSFFNTLITALGVLALYAILVRLGVSAYASFAAALVYAFGTLAWHYAGTMFSEPLMTLLVLLAFLLMIPAAGTKDGAPARGGPVRLLAGGLALGLAVAAHITAALFAPFFLFYVFQRAGGVRRIGAAWRPPAWYGCGLLIVLMLLGYYNFARFGSVLETGRWASREAAELFAYGVTIAPWRGLYGLLLGPGKGLFWFCPATLLGVIAFRRFLRAERLLALTVAAAVAVRIIFIASRSDWAGGFALGPRYLASAIPFLIIPLGFWLDAALREGRRRALTWVAAIGALLVAQQFACVLGEVFSYYQTVKLSAQAYGVDIFTGDALYLQWAYTPLTHLLSATPFHPAAYIRRGAFTLVGIHASNLVVWLAGSAAVVIILGVALGAFYRRGAVAEAPGKDAKPKRKRGK